PPVLPCAHRARLAGPARGSRRAGANDRGVSARLGVLAAGRVGAERLAGGGCAHTTPAWARPGLPGDGQARLPRWRCGAARDVTPPAGCLMLGTGSVSIRDGLGCSEEGG